MNDLELYRQEIDTIDRELLTLIKKRFDIIEKVGIYKKENNMPPLQPARWQEVLEKIKHQWKELNLNPKYIEIIWNTIHEYALEEEAK